MPKLAEIHYFIGQYVAQMATRNSSVRHQQSARGMLQGFRKDIELVAHYTGVCGKITWKSFLFP
jgi:hypothetical protein